MAIGAKWLWFFNANWTRITTWKIVIVKSMWKSFKFSKFQLKILLKHTKEQKIGIFWRIDQS